ncbi:MAG TPA: site-2 protease family protein [Planctomycetaceae bacterium]|jgi:Zn-dependent protease|nr:site-2 protease family protein [Planctomycetaceae bacterium]
MNNLVGGSFRLFRISGIQVYLHWSWLLVAYIEIVNRVNKYESMAWNVIEYLALFGIVLMHEFGHALACRQVGGQADRIMLWPLGGVAFVQPPPRPGALLWSIAAGPLVNVILVPITFGAVVVATGAHLQNEYPDFAHFLLSIAVINLALLVFNLLPIYPLDGGQILQALLWFVIGRARSHIVSGIIGLVAAAGVIVLALVRLQDTWLALVAAFVAWQAWRGFRFGVTLQGLQPTLDLMNEGLSAVRSGRHDDAVGLFTRVIDAGGESGVLSSALTNRGLVESRRGNWQKAIEDYVDAIRLQPKLASAHNNLAWLLATCPIDALRNGHEAVEHATYACEATGWSRPNCVGTLAAAYAEVGDFQQAVNLQQRVLADHAYCQKYGEATVTGRLRLYEQGVPCRLPGQGG